MKSYPTPTEARGNLKLLLIALATGQVWFWKPALLISVAVMDISTIAMFSSAPPRLGLECVAPSAGRAHDVTVSVNAPVTRFFAATVAKVINAD